MVVVVLLVVAVVVWWCRRCCWWRWWRWWWVALCVRVYGLGQVVWRAKGGRAGVKVSFAGADGLVGVGFDIWLQR